MADLNAPPKIIHPAVVGIYGGTNTGKSWFVKHLIEDCDNQIDTGENRIETVVYCYGSCWQSPLFEQLERLGVVMHKGLPSTVEDLMQSKKTPAILVFDDLESEMEKNTMIADCVKKNGHHMDLTIIMLFQTLYPLGKYMSGIRSNLNIQVFMKFPLVRQKLRLRFSDFCDKRAMDDFMAVYEKWTSRKGGYMLVDKHPEQTSRAAALASFRTNIFPAEGFPPLFMRLIHGGKKRG